jgi:hypothetical protein
MLCYTILVLSILFYDEFNHPKKNMTFSCKEDDVHTRSLFCSRNDYFTDNSFPATSETERKHILQKEDK